MDADPEVERMNTWSGRPGGGLLVAALTLAAIACSLLILAAVSCGPDATGGAPVRTPEPWVDRPVSEWPDFALTNDIRFADTTYRGAANAFLVDTGADTVAVTVKHMFLALELWRDDVSAIALGDEFVGWRFRSSREPGRVVGGRLLNEDPQEPIGDFASLKSRDWLVFQLDSMAAGMYPLKVRWEPLESGEVVHAVGRSLTERDARDPTLSPLRVFRAASTYYYVQPLAEDVDPEQTSGSPVIDEDGWLVGIVSGAVGNLGVISGVAYLRTVLGEHGIAVRAPAVGG